MHESMSIRGLAQLVKELRTAQYHALNMKFSLEEWDVFFGHIGERVDQAVKEVLEGATGEGEDRHGN